MRGSRSLESQTIGHKKSHLLEYMYRIMYRIGCSFSIEPDRNTLWWCGVVGLQFSDLSCLPPPEKPRVKQARDAETNCKCEQFRPFGYMYGYTLTRSATRR